MTEAPHLPHEDPDPARPYLDYRGSLAIDPSPRHGFPSAKAYVPREDMLGYWRHVQGLRAEEIRAAAEAQASDPAVAAALRAYLDGEPDPLGAAAAFETAAALTRLWPVTPHYRQFDAWILEHGTEFAACAALEQAAIRIVGERSGRPLALWIADTRGESPAVQFAPARPAGDEWGHGPEATAVRTLLAAMPEAEYLRYRELFEPRGRNHRQRLVRAFMMPTERDWVEEVCAEWPDRDSWSRSAEEMLAATVSSLDQLAALGIDSLPNRSGHSSSIGSLVEAFGAASAPFLLASVPRIGREYQGKASMHEVLAGLPHDGAVEYLLRNMIIERTFPLARDAAERFPRRTLRIIARIADEADPPLRARFAHLVATEPLLGAALEVADAPVREAIGLLLRHGGASRADAPPEAGNLPEFLANPPWKRKGAKRKKTVVEVGPIGGTGLRWRDGEQEAWREAAEGYLRRTAGTGDPAEEVRTLAKYPKLHRALPPLAGVEAARLAADWFVRLRPARVSVRDWLDRHGLDAALWLAPDAIGKAGRQRKAAEAVLRDVARRFGNEAVIAAAAPYGEAACAAVAEVVAADPLELDGRKAPKVPEWAEPVLGVPVLLRGGGRLPREAVEHVVAAMAVDSLAIPYAGIDIVKEHCDPVSLGAFSWAVFEAWEINDGPSKDSWALTQLARFADAGTVERLEACVRAWPDKRLSKRALNGLDVLGAIESEDALRAVHRLSRFRGSKAVKAAATEHVALVAADLGLDAEQLADRLVPEQGPASVTAEQVKRLEKAMVDGRTWSVGEFRRHLAGHPLLWELVRRLVWQAGPVAFRLAEDRTFADVDDDAIELPDDALVRISHPVLLGDALPAWVRCFADYELLQPFDQLGRAAHTATAAETEAGRLTRFEGRKATTGPLHGLTRGHWGAVRVENWTTMLKRPVPGGAVAVAISPGFGGGPRFDAEAVQVVEGVHFPADAIDPVALAEVIADLEKVAKG
ncbi:DUF4132 domain-containing protein [Glycomyces albidus]|uniref:DUF4132 domain-containing protein n=1 Tax=Glycomyces albidus TaxID=2656774 RepID=A0A6L5GEP7_9ACTN|nr:DUF4132 domain-containing protein [Glycomyces albidus]MQM28055.1 DUF4132 domain-containing protein [Glycomyces albidus]